MLSLHLTLFHFRISDSHFTFLLGDFIVLKILNLLHTMSQYADAIKAPITLHTWQKSEVLGNTNVARTAEHRNLEGQELVTGQLR